MSLIGSRTTSASLNANQTVDRASWGGQLRQRFLGKIWVHVGFSTDNSLYAASTLAGTARSDRGSSFDTGATIPVGQRSSLDLTYRHARNSSDATGYTYSSNQYSAGFNWRF